MLGTVLVHEAHFPQVVLFVELRLHALEAFFLLKLMEFAVQTLNFFRSSFLVSLEIGPLGEIELGNQRGDGFIADAFIDLLEKAEILVEHSHEPGEILALELGCAFAVADREPVGRLFHHHLHKLALVLDVLQRLASFQ